MAAARIGYRRNAIGISAGLGIALPLAAYAATLPFDGVNEAVSADSMPFAAGVVAGVGVLALTGHLLDRHAERLAEEEAEAARLTEIYRGAASARARQTPDQSSMAQRARNANRSGAPSGVPVISRAIDAMDEMEAWAEIDAMFNEDSRISCDPSRSKDMYQIALEELRRGDQVTTSAPAPDSPVGNAHGGAVQAPTPYAFDDLEEVDARNEAMASLYGSAAVARSYAPSMPTMSASVAVPVSASPTGPAAKAASPSIADSVRADVHEVPMADYSGHEDMWAKALAILEDDAASDEAPGNIGAAHFAPAETSYMDARRMAAIAEGGNATRMHSHVNALIEEEFDKVPSKSVHSTAHEYLKVIEGGTMGMPALQTAEA